MEIDLYDYIYPDGVVDVRVGEYKLLLVMILLIIVLLLYLLKQFLI